MPEKAENITQLLREWREGGAVAENRLFEHVYADLHRLARYRLKGERRDTPLQATELVDQIYIRLVAAKDRDWQNRQHFFAIAGRVMRRLLIDMARARPDVDLVGLEHVERFLPAGSTKLDAAIGLSTLLEELEQENPEWCNLVELKFFVGLTDEEAADVLCVKVRTLQRMWHGARRWLFERMQAGHAR